MSFNCPKVQLSQILFIDMNSQISDYDGLRFSPSFSTLISYLHILDFLGLHSKGLLLLVIQATSSCTVLKVTKNVEKVY